MTTLLDRAIFKLGADSREMVRGMRQANRSINQFTSRADRALNGMEKSFQRVNMAAKFLAGGFVANAFGGVLSRSLESADAVGKLSQRLGGTTQGISRLQFVAEQTGVQINTLNMGLQRMRRRVSEAAKGTGEARGALKELGLDVERLERLAPENQFRVIADAMEGVSNQGDRIRLAMKLFDSEGVSLVQTMQGGSKAIDALSAEADRLGVTIGSDFARQAGKTQDALNRVDRAFAGIGLRIAEESGPNLETFANLMSSSVPTAASTAIGWLSKVGEFSVWVGETMAAMGGNAIDPVRLDQQILAAEQDIGKLERILEGGISTLEKLQVAAINPELLLHRRGSGLSETAVEGELQRQINLLETLEQRQRMLEDLGGYKEPEAPKSKVPTDFSTKGHIVGSAFDTDKQESRLKIVADLTRRLATEEESINRVYENQRHLILENVRDHETRYRLLARNQDQQVESINKLWESQEKRSEKSAKLMEQFATQAGRNMQAAFSDFLFDPMDDRFESLAKNFSRTLRRMTAELASSKLLELIGRSLAGSDSAFVSGFGQALGGEAGSKSLSDSGGVPAVLQTGSSVSAKSLAPATGQGPMVNVYANDRARVERSPDGRLLEVFVGEVDRRIAQGGSTSKAIAQTFGAQVRPRVT